MPVTERFELRTAEGIDRLEAIGRSWRGTIYRSVDRPACYRLLAQHEAPLELRATLLSWVDQPRRAGLAPVVAAAQAEGPGLFFVRYEIALDCTLADALAEPDPAARLACAAAVVRALPAWWRALGHGVMPSSSDIVFSAGVPHLLPLPAMPPGAIETILDHGELAPLVAPELVRGDRPPAGDALDRYALGALLLGGFLRLQPDDAGEVLLRAANGTLFDEARLETALPFWLAQTDPARGALAAARSLVNPDPSARVQVDLAALATDLAQYAVRMEPVALASDLRARGKSEEALSLLADVMLERTSYELLMAFGDVALDLGRPLEALDSFERAVSKRSDRPEAYEAQLRAIAELEAEPGGQASAPAAGQPRGAHARLDMILWRDFHRLTPDRQTAHESTVARYLLNRRQYQPAATFIYPRLFRGRDFLSGKLSMNLAYGEALVGCGDPAAARHLAFVKDQVVEARLAGALTEDEARRCKQRLAELERALAAAGGPSAQPRPAGE